MLKVKQNDFSFKIRKKVVTNFERNKNKMIFCLGVTQEACVFETKYSY